MWSESGTVRVRVSWFLSDWVFRPSERKEQDPRGGGPQQNKKQTSARFQLVASSKRRPFQSIHFGAAVRSGNSRQHNEIRILAHKHASFDVIVIDCRDCLGPAKQNKAICTHPGQWRLKVLIVMPVVPRIQATNACTAKSQSLGESHGHDKK